jgi:hypothetical protein
MDTVKIKIYIFIVLLCKKKGLTPYLVCSGLSPLLQNKDDIYNIGYVGGW